MLSTSLETVNLCKNSSLEKYYSYGDDMTMIMMIIIMVIPSIAVRSRGMMVDSIDTINIKSQEEFELH